MSELVTKVYEARESNNERYFAHIKFREKILGTQPLSADIMEKWLRSKHTDEETIKKQMAAMGVDTIIEEEKKKSTTGFFQDEKGIYIGTYQLKAMLKELLSSLGITVSKSGSKQTMQHLLDVMATDHNGEPNRWAQADRLRFYRNGKVIREPDDWVEMTASVTNAQGTMSIIKRHLYVAEPDMYFMITTPTKAALRSRGGKDESENPLKGAYISEDELVQIMSYAMTDGVGCSRSQGFGKFEIVSFQHLDTPASAVAKPKPDNGPAHTPREDRRRRDRSPVAK